MIACLCVALGGAVGSVLRYLIGLIDLKNVTIFPYKTLIINIIGSFAIGILMALVSKHINISDNLLLFLRVGVCGGFTTFSTFALESVGLIQDGRTWLAILYMLISFIISILVIFAAHIIVK